MAKSVAPTIVSYLSLVHASLQFVASRSAGVRIAGVVGAELQSVFAVKGCFVSALWAWLCPSVSVLKSR